MKRILSSIVVLLIFFSCSINCYAAEYKETRTGDVYGKYNFYSNEGIYTAISSDGSYEVTTDNGVHIKVNCSRTELTLVVHQISKLEKECYDWFESCFSQDVASFIPYDIFFLDSSGERVELAPDMEMAISKSQADESVLWLSYDGTTTTLTYTVNNDELVFKTTNIGGYYLLYENMSEAQSPQTGDTSNIHFWILLLIISLVMLVITTRKYRTLQKTN